MRAIEWAVDQGARVINMSLGGVRDPLDASVDTYSPLEAAAVDYAVRRNVVVVAAVGTATRPSSPWRFASYPAALPHVLGVAALAQRRLAGVLEPRPDLHRHRGTGRGHPVDLPARADSRIPGLRSRATRAAGGQWRSAEGTSFAAPQVSAAAAALLGQRPSLRAEQVVALLTRTAVDANASTGCRTCPLGRDRYTGFGRVDVTSALQALDGLLPGRDRYEPNDDAGPAYRALYPVADRRDARLLGRPAGRLPRPAAEGQRMYAGLTGPPRTDVNLMLWAPGTTRVGPLRRQSMRVTQSARPGPARVARVPGAAAASTTCRSRWRASAPAATGCASRREPRHRRSSSSSSGTSRTTRAGLPTTSARGGTSFVTTAPAPTNASSPISTAGQRTAPPPTRAPRRIVGP